MSAHPDRLLWYANDRLDVQERAEVECHVLACDACRAEVEALRDVYRTLRRAPSGHPIVERLVAYHDGHRLEDGEKLRIEEHVRACAACKEDLARLDDASVPAPRRRIAYALAAASVLLLVAAAWLGRTPRTQHIVFEPTERAASALPVLSGAGPWELELWPALRTESEYVARIARDDAPAVTAVETLVGATPEGSVRVRVARGALRRGRHTITLAPRGDDGLPYTRGFDVDTRR